MLFSFLPLSPLPTPFTCGQHLKNLLLYLRLDPSFERLLLSREANKKSHSEFTFKNINGRKRRDAPILPD